MIRAEIRCLAALFRSEPGADDARILTVSHLVAACLALMWLTLVYFGPRPVATAREPEIIITVVPPVVDVLPSPPRELTRRSSATESRSDASRTRTDIREAFAGLPGAPGRSDLVKGVRIAPSVPTSDPLARPVPLGAPTGRETPGRSRAAGEGLTGADIGVVKREGVGRAEVAILPPEVRAVSGEGVRGDATEVGQSARAYAPQLQRCYLDEGLTINPQLAGLVRLAIEVEGGRVVAARVVDRSWSGAGVAETESCLVRAVRGWRLGTSTARVTLPFSFTSGAR